MNNINIEDLEIKKIEEILLGSSKFDNLRKEIIKDFNNSFDVNACPGSGKTTVLLAKLMLLADKMPFDDGRGICVFTHTNVAVDEIKNRLGSKGDILFKYPNYIGTIDGFVNKYLTSPFYKTYYNNDIKSIDDEEYKKILSKRLQSKGYVINNQTWTKKYGKYIDFIAGYSKLLTRNISITNNTINIDIPIQTVQLKKSYSEIISIMNDILEEGFLIYKDSYYLAEIYIEYKSTIKELFKERFKFIFIDEMQDTFVYQQNLLDEIFNDENLIIQRFGDKNQNIISKDNPDEKCGWKFHDNLKEINNTKRYGNSISNVLNYIKYSGKEQLEGNSDVDSLNPHIIVFDNYTSGDVINKFKELIIDYKLNKRENNHRYKCIGRISQRAKNASELTIPSYSPNFIKKSITKDKCYETELYKIINNNNVNDYFDIILEIVIRTLRENDIKYEKSKLKKLLEEKYSNKYNLFKQQCLEIYSAIKKAESDSANIEKLKNNLVNVIKLFNFDKAIDSTYIEQYFKSYNPTNIEKDSVSKEVAVTNISDDLGIHIETINSVKGETHTATLYLETKYTTASGQSSKDVGDIKHIIEFMCGEKDIREDDIIKDENIISSLNIAYVAMSRPSHLLCIAMHIDTVKDKIESLESVGYEIIGCTNEINQNIRSTI